MQQKFAMKYNIGIIIQARTGSTRLPNKTVLPFYEDKSVLQIIIEKLKSDFSIPIILATTTNPSDDVLEEIATLNNIKYFRGDENNVLKRFIDCAALYKIDIVIRVCADNPFLETYFINQLISQYDLKKCNYISFSTKESVPAMKTHYGLFAELVELDALKKINNLTVDTLYTEHVTNYIYTHPEIFSLNFLQIPNELQRQNIRLTLDTGSNLTNLKYIYCKLKRDKERFDYKNILALLEEEKNILSSMKQEKFKKTN